jgi:hypothetical protein
VPIVLLQQKTGDKIETAHERGLGRKLWEAMLRTECKQALLSITSVPSPHSVVFFGVSAQMIAEDDRRDMSIDPLCRVQELP